MHAPRMLAVPVLLAAAVAIHTTATGCFSEETGCEATLTCPTTGPGGSAGQGGGGQGGTAGGGGDPCGGCTGDAPLCDPSTNTCVACLDHADCTELDAAKCDAGTCVPCDDSMPCAGRAGTEVCSAGTCVECALGEEDACGSTQTCDLLANTCVDVAPGTVDACGACTNDAQCVTDHRCIPMEFPLGTPHGYYCLREFPPACVEPLTVPANDKTSISDAGPANYCGLNEDLTTCEAVLALQDNWRCSGTDGMCSPDGMQPEVPVPGALCRDLAGGALANRCTYACGNASQCLDATQSPAQSTCGDGPMNEGPPDWCGG